MDRNVGLQYTYIVNIYIVDNIPPICPISPIYLLDPNGEKKQTK